MDSAVALVQAYLYANGYFTVTEYPVVELLESGEYRIATDIDILALRLPHAGRLIPRRIGRGVTQRTSHRPDPALVTCNDCPDLIIAEVKEGQAEINRSARDPDVLRSVLQRFGGPAVENPRVIVDDLLRSGEARIPQGPRIRLIAFGAYGRRSRRHPYKVITLGHITRFIEELTEQHWELMQHASIKDPAVGILRVLAKARRGGNHITSRNRSGGGPQAIGG